MLQNYIVCSQIYVSKKLGKVLGVGTCGKIIFSFKKEMVFLVQIGEVVAERISFYSSDEEAQVW